jgi:predicted DNA-binding protein
MMILQISDALEKRLMVLAANARVSKEDYALQALEEFVCDQEDYLLASSRLVQGGEGLPLKEVMEEIKSENGE